VDVEFLTVGCSWYSGERGEEAAAEEEEEGDGRVLPRA
jgi:hypothetical protein